MAEALLESKGRAFAPHAKAWSNHCQLNNYWSDKTLGKSRVVSALRAASPQAPTVFSTTYLDDVGLLKAMAAAFGRQSSHAVAELAALAWRDAHVELAKPKGHWRKKANRVAHVREVAMDVLGGETGLPTLNLEQAAVVAHHLEGKGGMTAWQMLHEFDAKLPSRPPKGLRRGPRVERRSTAERIDRIRQVVEDHCGPGWEGSLDGRRKARSLVLASGSGGRSGRSVMSPQRFLAEACGLKRFVSDERERAVDLLPQALPLCVHRLDVRRRTARQWRAVASAPEAAQYVRWIVETFYGCDDATEFHGDAGVLRRDRFGIRIASIFGNLHTALARAYGARVVEALPHVHSPRGTRSDRATEVERARGLIAAEIDGRITRSKLRAWVATKQNTAGGLKVWRDDNQLTQVVRVHFGGITGRLVMEAYPGLMHPWEFRRAVSWRDPHEGPAMAKAAIEFHWKRARIDPSRFPSRAAGYLREACLKELGLRSVLRVAVPKAPRDAPRMYRLARSLWPDVAWNKQGFYEADVLTKLGLDFEKAARRLLRETGLREGKDYLWEPATPVGLDDLRADVKWLDRGLSSAFGASFVDFKLSDKTMSRSTRRVAANYDLVIVFAVETGADPQTLGCQAREFLPAPDFAVRLGSPRAARREFGSRCHELVERFFKAKRR